MRRPLAVLKHATNAVPGGSRKPFHGETFRRWLPKHGCAFDELPWDTGVIALPTWRPIGKFVKAVIYLGSSWRRLDPGQFKRIVESRAGVGDGFATGGSAAASRPPVTAHPSDTLTGLHPDRCKAVGVFVQG